MEINEFNNLAKEKFGDKIVVCKLNVDIAEMQKINAYRGYNLKQEYFQKYDELPWLKTTKCPSCDSELLGMFGSFRWGIIHGVGFCSNCNNVEFQYYHYFGKDKYRIEMFSVCGFK